MRKILFFLTVLIVVSCVRGVFSDRCYAVALPENTLFGVLVSLTYVPPSVTIQTDASHRTTRKWLSETTVFQDREGGRITPNAFSSAFGKKLVAIVMDDFNSVIRAYPLDS
jgi:hypothetical protein